MRGEEGSLLEGVKDKLSGSHSRTKAVDVFKAD
jgi:hypothetical protein